MRIDDSSSEGRYSPEKSDAIERQSGWVYLLPHRKKLTAQDWIAWVDLAVEIFQLNSRLTKHKHRMKIGLEIQISQKVCWLSSYTTGNYSELHNSLSDILWRDLNRSKMILSLPGRCHNHQYRSPYARSIPCPLIEVCHTRRNVIDQQVYWHVQLSTRKIFFLRQRRQTPCLRFGRTPFSLSLSLSLAYLCQRGFALAGNCYNCSDRYRSSSTESTQTMTPGTPVCVLSLFCP